jgi:glycogen operon protein
VSYRLDPAHPKRYLDFTGCGNTVNARHPQVLKLIMDSLRYWVLEMHVDGFRFDLAPTLAREEYAVERLSSFFDVIHQDPVISHVKLIAEPWDLGDGGYHVGNFPVIWSEWNGRYRDTVRSFWRGDYGMVSDLAYRLTGSSDLYSNDGRHPWASVNFVTSHDGFTLNDLVSYDKKHNEMNGEGNRDGSDHNRSWNCGVEGPTSDPAVLETRGRQRRNFLTTLLLSNGVPMLTAGDEIGRTQRGNNNAYCQDNEISWVDWDLAQWQEDLLEFTRILSEFRRGHPHFRKRGFFDGRRNGPSGLKDVYWLRADGTELTDRDWQNGALKILGVLYPDEPDGEGEFDDESEVQDHVLMYFNAGSVEETFNLPALSGIGPWRLCIDTAAPEDRSVVQATQVRVRPHSMLVLTRTAAP